MCSAAPSSAHLRGPGDGDPAERVLGVEDAQADVRVLPDVTRLRATLGGVEDDVLAVVVDPDHGLLGRSVRADGGGDPVVGLGEHARLGLGQLGHCGSFRSGRGGVTSFPVAGVFMLARSPQAPPVLEATSARLSRNRLVSHASKLARQVLRTAFVRTVTGRWLFLVRSRQHEETCGTRVSLRPSWPRPRVFSAAATPDVTTSASAHTPAVSKKSITLGGTFPLSGPASIYAPIPRGMEAYFKWVNSRKGPDGKQGVYGRKIVWKYYDDNYNPAQTVQLHQQAGPGRQGLRRSSARSEPSTTRRSGRC